MYINRRTAFISSSWYLNKSKYFENLIVYLNNILGNNEKFQVSESNIFQL